MKRTIKTLGLSALAVGLVSPASAWDILYLANNSTDPAIQIQWLTDQGHDVTLGYVNANPGFPVFTPAEAEAQFDLIWVGRKLSSGDFDNGTEPNEWNAVKKPLINQCAYVWRGNYWGWQLGNNTINAGLNFDSYDAYPNASHPFLDDGLGGTVGTTIMTGPELDNLNTTADHAPVAGAEVIATIGGGVRNALFYLEHGTVTNNSNGTLGAARVAIAFGEENDFRFRTTDGEQIMVNIIQWMVDRDLDGMADHWEDKQFGNDDGLIEDTELALQDGTGDQDSDGATDLQEYQHGSDPYVTDTDFDSLSDGDEINTHGSDPTQIDSDADTITDPDEVYGLANPWVAGDPNAGPPGEPTDPAKADTDDDGILDREEMILGADNYVTDPNNADSDNDGFTDGFEIANDSLPNDPFHPFIDNSGDDPDQDGLVNSAELGLGTDVLNPDSDGDSLSDGGEVDGTANPFGDPTDPLSTDSDFDTITDGEEVIAGTDGYVTNPASADTDSDGFYDDFEIANSGLPVDPFDPTVDNGGDDPDEDGLVNSDELNYGTDELNPDTDGEGRLDGEEVNGSPTSEPLVIDTDADLANDKEEVDNGTDPNVDTDTPGVAWLQLDFSNTTATEWSGVHEVLYQGYFATRGVLAADDPDYGVDRTDVPYDATYFSTTGPVLVSVSYPDITDPGAEFGTMIVIDRAANMGTYEGTKGELVQDWIGVDSRSGATLRTFRLTLADLPAGDYLLRTYHHDQENQATRFTTTVTDSDSAAVELPAVLRQTTQLSGNNPATPGVGNGPEVLTSTLEQVIRSNGTPVVIDFTVIGNDTGDPIPDDIFAINGFELTETVDSDGDDIADATEIAIFGDITTSDGTGDQDGDGISDLTEILQNTDPTNDDTDGDGLADGLETDTGFLGSATVDILSFSTVPDPTDPTISMDWTPAVESDIYGSLDLMGFPILVAEGVTPPVTDLSLPPAFDGEPAGFFMVDPPPAGEGTSPFIADTDGDGLSDGDEVNIHGSSPLSTETDGDGFTDAHEVMAGSDPADPNAVPDQDGDGYANSTETNAGTDPDDANDFPEADSATEFWVDFNSAGTVADPLNPADPTTPTYPQSGYQSYHAKQETATTFVSADYTAFGTTVTLTPIFPGYETTNAVQQSYDRGDGNAATWDGDERNMMRDWIGVDTRPGGGAYDGTTGTPTPIEITLAGLPAGDYDWTSFHHDVENMWSDFRVEVSVDGGTTYGAPTDLTMTDGQPGGAPASPQTYDGPVNPGSLLPEDLPSTFTTSFTADGTNSVVFRFTTLSTDQVHRAFFALNAFKLSQVPQ